MNDPLLAPLIDAADATARRRAIEEVLTRHVQPAIRMVVARYRGADRMLRREEADDVEAIVTLRLLRRLQRVGIDQSIENLVDFTATLTYNAIYDVFRSRFPERTRLRNRIRHTLERDARFTTWQTPSGLLCGLRAMPEAAARAPVVVRGHLHGELSARLGDAIATILRDTGAPVAVGELARVLAELLGVTDAADATRAEQAQEAVQLTAVEQRQQLERLWTEIAALTREHRAALLLNLREAGGGNALALFISLGVATIDDVAAALGLTVERLAELWSNLPLDDASIAEILGVTRQQVINFRRSARERLLRRAQ